MSHLNGIWYFDGRPAPSEDERWVRSAPNLSNHHQAELRRGAGLLMSHRPSDFDAEANKTCAVSSDDGICALDGRIDSRKELLSRLGQPSTEPVSDSGIALRLYQERGTDGLRDLIGDWSLVIADARSHSLILASDYAGIRPLYYRRTASCIMWSSSLSHVARRDGTNDLDEEYIAGFLTKGSAAHRTPYRDVYPVPPGRAVCVSRESVSIRSFWDLPVDKEIRFNNPGDYEEQLLNLFREAVEVRLPSNGPVRAELSGGLDSSSIVCMADHIAMQRASAGAAAKPLPFTYTHQDSTDEKYVRAVERARDLTSTRLDLEKYSLVAADQTGNGAPAWWEPRYTELRRQFTATGATVFLTGQLGDFVMGNMHDDSVQAVDFLRAGNWPGAVRETYAWSQSLRIPIYPLLWRAFKTAYSPWTASTDFGVINQSPIAGQAHSLSSRFLKRMALARNKPLPDRSWREARPSRRSRYRTLSEILDSGLLQAPELLQHISYTHPYVHRPLVEFMLTIPPAEICRPGEPRRLMRRAFDGLLPPAILKRRSKAAYGSPYRRALLPLAAEMLAQPARIQLIAHDYVEGRSLTDRLNRLVQGLDCNEPQLRQLLLFEFWLRNRERGVSARGPALTSVSKDYLDTRQPSNLTARA